MINKSLLALKGCLRGIHLEQQTGAKRKLPFRDSSITRLLEEVLIPKRGRDSDTVMLVNCAALARLEKKTVNSLRYGQLYASASVGANGTSSRGMSKNGHRSATSCDPRVLAEIRAIYAEFVPDKTSADVSAILGKFCGREEELLVKVRAKYRGAA